ncbi:MAG: hypothetical protein ACI9MC_000687 [Kiritimatiellia bacterium]|jgi:hypothetical protein
MLFTACSSPTNSPADPPQQYATPAPDGPSIERRTLTRNGAIEFQVFLDNKVYDVVEGHVPGDLTLRRPAQSHRSGQGLRDVPLDLELVHGDTSQPIHIGENIIIGDSTLRVELRPTVLRRWNGLMFEHDRSFVVTEIPVASMLSLQLNRPGMTVQFFLTRALRPADAVSSLLVAFPQTKTERVSRTIGGTQQQGERSRLSAGEQTIISEVFAWSIDEATVAVLVQHDDTDDRRVQDSAEHVLRSLSVKP